MTDYFIYILASKKNGTLYIGATMNLKKRIWEHKCKFIDSFTKKYNVTRLVYFEVHIDLKAALEREHQLKRWKRSWKISLIEKENLNWCDLYNDII